MSSPTGVSNASMGFKGLCEVGLLVFNEFLQLGNLANFFEGTNFIFLVTVDRKTGRVIATVFKSRKPYALLEYNGPCCYESWHTGNPPLSMVSRMNLRSLSTR